MRNKQFLGRKSFEDFDLFVIVVILVLIFILTFFVWKAYILLKKYIFLKFWHRVQKNILQDYNVNLSTNSPVSDTASLSQVRTSLSNLLLPVWSWPFASAPCQGKQLFIFCKKEDLLFVVRSLCRFWGFHIYYIYLWRVNCFLRWCLVHTM